MHDFVPDPLPERVVSFSHGEGLWYVYRDSKDNLCSVRLDFEPPTNIYGDQVGTLMYRLSKLQKRVLMARLLYALEALNDE